MGRFSCFFIILAVLSSIAGQNELPQYLKRKYGNFLASPSPRSYSGVKTSGVKTKKLHSPRPPIDDAFKSSKYRGGCNAMPPTPLNSRIHCSQYSGCKVDCIPNYQLPNGASQVFMTCQNGEWVVEAEGWKTVPACQPVCLPPCLNNGICVAPNQCSCPRGFSGPVCQFEDQECLVKPPVPRGSEVRCISNKVCNISCMKGYQFPDGSQITTITCKNGYWTPSQPKWTSVPDCEAVCSPPCENGGVCMSSNYCRCPQKFRGPQCQYNIESCNPKKLNFVGGYNCTGENFGMKCILHCPPGMEFGALPAPEYVCLYSEGVYKPTPTPTCVFPNLNLNIVPLEANEIPILPPSKPSPYEAEWITSGPLGHGDGLSFTTPGVPEELYVVQEKLPKPGICFTWQGTHYKTFDGKVFSFNSKCAHTLVRDAADNTFSVVVQDDPRCEETPSDCSKIIRVYLDKEQYILKRSEENGMPMFATQNKRLPIPAQLPGLRAEMSAHFVFLSLDTVGSKIKWDGKQLVEVQVQESLWNRTEGLCGRLDSDASNDMLEKSGHTAETESKLASSWQVDDLEHECNDLQLPVGTIRSQNQLDVGPRVQEAVEFCKSMLSNGRLSVCHSVINIALFFDACRGGYLYCTLEDPAECACQTAEVYVRSCIFNNVKDLTSWRNDKFCPMKCKHGRVYRACGPPSGQPVCGSNTQENEETTQGQCEEGCYCPEGTVLHENRCITRDKCPCLLRGKSFQPGSEVPKDCNTCTCSEGKWVCTQVSCGARCAAVGDPHYVTFDGKRYDFMGQCSYYLVKTESFSIEAENVACAGSISKAMNLPISVSSGLPSCTKTVTVRISGNTIKLKQNHDVVVNGQDVTQLPYHIGNITIRTVSSMFLQVDLPNGMQVWWDGVTSVYIDIPPGFPEQTRGLCGTFTNNQKDDFLTPEDDVEHAVIPFANKWKTSERCSDLPDNSKSHPCSTNVQNQPTAERHCQTIKSSLFEPCHWFVDPEPFYQDCLYDICSCETQISKCLCATVAAYAAECARQGVKIQWRESVRECGVHCPSGQMYQVCGNSCTRTCFDTAARPDCMPQCVEGCNCPEGQALDEEGECVPVGECKCLLDGLRFHPGYKKVRNASEGPELCTCVNARWSCRAATPGEVDEYPNIDDSKAMCSATDHLEFTTCEPVEPVTCKNMHSIDYFSATICHPGCKCEDGYVLDTSTKKCIKPSECPCHHGGKSYKENETVQNDCNTCRCQNGKWMCTERPCAGECTAWGDSHFKTFDGKHFDFQGQCDYVLAKGATGSDSFDISIQNVPCGSLGTSCSKSVTIRVKSAEDQDTVTLTRDKSVPKHSTFKHVILRQAGLLIIVEASDLGIVVQWDRGTRVYVKIDPRWKGRTQGLCGNYNDNNADDFQTPSGGIPEASAKIFGDSWKLQPFCPETLEITNTCEDRPDRKVWALQKCGILKSSIFAPCHTEVPVDIYLEKCVFDACACDQGGDCECLCTALAAYAQECNSRGVPVRWRSQELCPIQCDESCSNYSPCISTCPLETCDDLVIGHVNKICKEEACVEGCAPKPCPPDHVYLNSSASECVPRNICKPFCMEVDGVKYYEGELMEEDACHSCYCSHRRKVCKGQPCSTTQLVTAHVATLTTHTSTSMKTEPILCKSGWTDWVNQDKAVPTKSGSVKKTTDYEPLPSSLVMNNIGGAKCDKTHMTDIECQIAGTNRSVKEMGLNVQCTLEEGLICEPSDQGEPCPDFEIRVFCACELSTTVSGPTEFSYSVSEIVTVPESTTVFSGSSIVSELTTVSQPATTETAATRMLTTVPTPCDLLTPHTEHESNCHLYYLCENTTKGPLLKQKTCGPTKYYHPVLKKCDWPYAVEEVKPECKNKYPTSTTPVPTECPIGTVRRDCVIHCDRLCQYYAYQVQAKGQCPNEDNCEPACVDPNKNSTCPEDKLHADQDTCVDQADCMCRSNDGKPVKPGDEYRESDCETCQCINNFYSCWSSCTSKKAKPSKPPTGGTISVPSPVPTPSVTPPEECDEERFADLIQGDTVPGSVFSASSERDQEFGAQNARFDVEGSWAPESSSSEEYLQIDLGRQEPLYGIKVKGSTLYDEYVTSYTVSYSPDGKGAFKDVINQDGLPQIFRGSIDSKKPVQQLFRPPFEAQIVRIHPKTWHNAISLKVELIGCGEVPVTTETVTNSPLTTVSTNQIMCDDPMGLDDGTMLLEQISVSSELDHEHSKSHLKLSGENAWQPFTSSPTEFVKFDFLEPRNITGLVIKGGSGGWVEAFTIEYSHNNKDWNPVVDKMNTKERTFPGNYDEDTPVTIHFDLPINVRYMKLVPTKWHDNIQMRVEIHGCFVPYPTVPVPLSTSTPGIKKCNVCKRVKTEPLELGACRCPPDKWWDGENCVKRSSCPCISNNVRYPVGAMFTRKDCWDCMCKLGGVAYCNEPQCPPCENGLRSTVTTTCECTCQPCPEGTTLCPTSNICINTTLWCNGVKDCPDDEIGCITSPKPTEPIIITTTQLTPSCPEFECRPGFKKVLKSKSSKYHSAMFLNRAEQGLKYRYVGVYGGVKTATKTKVSLPTPPPLSENEIRPPACPEYKCVYNKTRPPPCDPKDLNCTLICDAIYCQEGLVPVLEEEQKSGQCPKYTCERPPEPDVVCKVSGKSFNTFDGTEYEYDICNHVLARDLENDEWRVTLTKNCTGSCRRDLVINHQDHTFVLHSDLMLELDDFKYTADQATKIGSQSQAFDIKKLGDSLVFVSVRYGFWVRWNDQGEVEVGVVTKLAEKVDGLCGYFNNIRDDDKRKPDGTPARTTQEFGDSWQVGTTEVCESPTCSAELKKRAWEMCLMKEQILQSCATVVNMNSFVSRCVDKTCDCLRTASGNQSAVEECRCSALTDYVVECLTAKNDTDLTDWRITLDCPVTCEAPLVHHDCYQRRCELTCESVDNPQTCLKVPQMCFPGCYCPAGFVKKGDTCIKPSECKDCECNVLPHLKYVTYDDRNFTVNANCVYVMSRDRLVDGADGHKFQVLTTHAPCEDDESKMCVGKVTVLYEGHKIHVVNDPLRRRLKLIVDGERVDDLAELGKWVRVKETGTKHLKILLVDVHVEVSVYHPSLGVSVKAPSQKYAGKLEGLCGDCNRDPRNDFATSSRQVVDDVDEFASSWLYEKIPGQSKETCRNRNISCTPLPEDTNPCNLILDYKTFGQCLRLLDPSLFLDWCKSATCDARPEYGCKAIEAYATDCSNAGFCIDWRTNICPKQCPAGQVHEPCGTSCPKTCETVKNGKTGQCSERPVDGCFCPEGKILFNDTSCVEEAHCTPCDNEGHYSGDSWTQDKCTNCTCEGTVVKCDTEKCSEGLICEEGFRAVTIPAKEDECCDKYACVPEPTMGPTCEPPKPINCGYGQVTKLFKMPNGCEKFVCQCVPPSECPEPIIPPAPSEEGFILWRDVTGCCDVLKYICSPGTCSHPKPCPPYHTLETEQGKCCPSYSCEPPKDKCQYETGYISAKEGGERQRTDIEKQTVYKNVNESWDDGPCRRCTCSLTSEGTYLTTCTVTDCPQITESEDYELEKMLVYDRCCPEFTRVACKQGDRLYKDGDTWTKESDPCTVYKCIKNGDVVEKKIEVQSCNLKCDINFEYVPATEESGECCGSCKQIACSVGEKSYKEGEQWQSDDHCTNYFCLKDNGTLQVQSNTVNCPEPPLDYSENFVYDIVPVEGECCKVYNKTACKVGDKVYQVGETWPSPDGDECKKITCVMNDNGEISKKETIEICKTNCSKGWENVKSNNSTCCGECVQVACVVDDVLKYPGNEWKSNDNCTTYECVDLGNQLMISSSEESCPSLNDCPQENIYTDGCCKRCKVTSLPKSICTKEELPLNQTVGIVKKIRHGHGLCENKQPIPEFTHCIGVCKSSTSFDKDKGTFESECSCCQTVELTHLDVELECEDGHVTVVKVPVPSECNCGDGCGEKNNYTKTKSHPHTKT